MFVLRAYVFIELHQSPKIKKGKKKLLHWKKENEKQQQQQQQQRVKGHIELKINIRNTV